MLVSCICVCHNKPDLAHEAIQSILNQSYPHWQALIVDSGVLHDAGYYDQFGWRHDKRLRLIRSEETDEIRRTKAMAPWCYNECFRRGLVSGDLVMYLCDDDVLYANAFATFVSYCRRNPHAQAMYASQDIAIIYPNGWRAIIGERRATEPGGRSCNGRRMDCHVDYLQFCHRAQVLPLFARNEYWPESKESESHADGIFMERVGEHVTIYPIDVKISQNRRTQQSTYVPVRSFAIIECMANGIPSARSAERGAQSAESEAALCASRSALSASVLEDAPLVTISVTCRDPGAYLPDTLASMAAQTYPNLEVLVIDNGSTNDQAATRFEAMRATYPRFRFLRRSCTPSGVTRDRGVWQARGVYFITVDDDTLACPDMVERLVAAMRGHPHLSAMTCYVLAVREAQDLSPEPDASASGSTERAWLLASTKNIYSGGIFHTATLRKAGGYGTDQDIPGQDWTAFLRLVNNGYQVDILPEHLFSYRRPASRCLRSRDDSLSRGPLLQPFFQADRVLAAERVALWTAFDGMQRRLEELAEQNQALHKHNQALQARCESLRYQIADRLILLCDRVPFAKRSMQWLLCSAGVLGRDLHEGVDVE